jgi:hypothetical protein
MSRRQAALVAGMCAMLAGCAGAGPTPSDPVGVASPHATPSLASATPSPTTVAATPTPEPTPTPTPKPVPPKPTGVKLDYESESMCDPSGDGLCEVSGFWYTVSWKTPRAKGIEIRVYGVTKCFGWNSDGAIIDGWCLREHTALPKSGLALLAKAPASKGKVTWRMNERGLLDGHGEGDTYYLGDRFYSVVLAAYDGDGEHSIFAIGDVTHLCNFVEALECPDDPFWPGDGE